jgi:hypothetical protein
MSQKWIYKPWYDVAFILAPPFLCLLVVVIFPATFLGKEDGAEVNTLWWIVLILGVDVAHVYATLYRTYFDKETFAYYRSIYILFPSWCL